MTIIKARIIRAIPDDGLVDDAVIVEFQQELNALNEALPEWMTMGSLINSQQSTPLRKVVFYFHLFFLSAMQLLHRRTMANPTHCSSPGRLNTRTSVREGLMAAKMTARMLALMQEERYIGQFCWMCIYSSYTSGIIILQAAVQKILSGYHSSTWMADLSLANMCIRVLDFCSQVDSVAGRMKDVVHKYMRVLQVAVQADLDMHVDPGKNDNEDVLVDYLFCIPAGETMLHKAARDLLLLIQYPFGTSLELLPEGGPKAPLRNTLVNWMEAAVGIPQEWDWELQKCGLKEEQAQHGQGQQGQQRHQRQHGLINEIPMREVVSTLGSGRFLPMGETSPWTVWTVHTF